MPMDHIMLNQPPLPLVARRRTKRHIREFVVQYERHRTFCEREGGDDEAMSAFGLVDDAIMDTVCCHAFRGRSLMDGMTEEDILEALRREAGMLDKAISALELKIAIRDVACTKPAMSVVERIHEVKMGMINLLNENGWRQAVPQRFNRPGYNLNLDVPCIEL